LLVINRGGYGRPNLLFGDIYDYYCHLADIV